MYRLFFIFWDVILAALFLVPLGFILQHFFSKRSFKRKLLFVFFSLYIAGLFSAVGIPDIRSLVFDPSFNLIPLIDIINDPISYIRNEVLNILLFVPLGFLLPILWSKNIFTFKQTIIFAAGLSLLIEVSQIFTFRLTDIDDVWTNTLGAGVGYYFLLFCQKYWNIKLDIMDGKLRAKIELPLLISLIVVIMFFVTPYFVV